MKSIRNFITFVIILNVDIIYSDAKPSVNSMTPDVEIGKFSSNIRSEPNQEEFEIPIQIVDPYEFDWVEFNLPGEIFSFNMNISKGSVSGLSKLQILSLTSTQPSLEFNLLFPHLKFHSEYYELDGKVFYAVPLKGKGEALVEMFNLQVWGTIFVKSSPSNNGLLLDKFENSALKLERIESKIDFDHNIDAIVSALVEEPLCDYLNRFNKFIIAKYGDILVKHINDLLEEFDMNNP